MSNKDYYEFKSYFQIAPMVLYVGHNISADALKVIMAQPWSCIITSRTDNAINSILKGSDQNTKEIINSDSCTLPLIKMGRSCLYLIKLFNTNSGEETDPEDAYILLREFFQKYMRGSARMIVVGYDDSAKNEIDLSHFEKLIKIASQNSIQFWAPHFSKPIAAAFENKQVSIIDDTLEQLLGNDSSSDLFQSDLLVSSSDIIHDTFYLDGKAVTISEEECYDLKRFSSTVSLLTENTVNKIMPNGLLLVQKWFFNFLNDSPLDGPQWYGYHKRTEYYVERSYESKLKSLINIMLAGKVHKHNLDYGPIILSGNSCSSKTITLCSLAYKYFLERKVPVVYIKNNTITPYEGSDELKDIRNLLQYIEDKMSNIETPRRILVFWDCSNFRDVEKNVRGLFNSLSNDGRRFVLVCSSYPNPDEKNTAKYYRSGMQVNFGEDFDYYRNASCYYVCSDRQMDDREIRKFWSVFREYSGLSNSTINYWQQNLSSETDVFSYYYKMVALLRKNLEQKLSIEEDTIKGYIEREFDAILNNYGREEEKTEYQLQLEKYLNEISEDTSSLHKEDEESNAYYNSIDRLLILVAMFSKYNIGLPYDIICYFIKQNHNSDQAGAVYFSTDDQRIFRALTKIPLFSYSDTDNSGFTFRFRNSLEAQVFLNRKDTNGSIQFELLLELIDLFIDEYLQTGEFDGDFAKCLRDYINLSGPNSLYYLSSDNYIEEDDSHEYFLNKIPELLKKILELLRDVDNLTASIGFAHTFVTFTREYYVNNDRSGHLPIEDRLQYLEDAIRFAKEKMDEIKIEIKGNPSYSVERYLTDEYHALATEYAFTYYRIKRIQKESGVSLTKEQKYDNFEFESIYLYLREIIAQKPTNGYAYNALFSNFLLMHETEKSSKRKLEYLCKMLEIINDSNGLEIVKRGTDKDYLSDNITKIFECCDKVDISIDSITNRDLQTDPHMLEYLKMYDAWLEANNPIAVIFVCMKELKNADVMLFGPSKSDPNSFSDFVMTKGKENACKKVISFMTHPDNRTAVYSDSFALELLVRTKWVLFNKKPLQGNLNRQMTSLKKAEWEQILELCDLYAKAALNTKTSDNSKPVIMLVYALSKIQADEDYVSANRILQEISSNMRGYSNNERTRAPYMLCDEYGKPKEYTGCAVYKITKPNEGYLRVPGVPLDMGTKHRGVYFKINNFGRKAHIPEANDLLPYPIEISIGYIGLSAYTHEGRIEWGDTV